MLTPEYLAATPDALVELYGKIEQDILANMAERIAKYDYYIPAVQHQHQRLRAMGMLETEIEQQLAALTGKTQAELKKLMAQAVDEALTSDAKIYAAAGMVTLTLSQSPAFARRCKAVFGKQAESSAT